LIPEKKLPSGHRWGDNSHIQFIEPGSRLSSATIHKGIIHTAGVVCEEGGESKGMRQQTVDALDDLDRILELCNSDKHHILSMQVFILSMQVVFTMNFTIL
jgi:enamine deaminase RidA (YjgF/YER057c/UK114 family)